MSNTSQLFADRFSATTQNFPDYSSLWISPTFPRTEAGHHYAQQKGSKPCLGFPTSFRGECLGNLLVREREKILLRLDLPHCFFAILVCHRRYLFFYVRYAPGIIFFFATTWRCLRRRSKLGMCHGRIDGRRIKMRTEHMLLSCDRANPCPGLAPHFFPTLLVLVIYRLCSGLTNTSAVSAPPTELVALQGHGLLLPSSSLPLCANISRT